MFAYPNTKRDESICDDYFRTKVKDPYRFLEDPESEETQKWVDEECVTTNGYFEKNCKNERDKIRKRMDEVYNYVKIGCPFKEGDHWYYFKNDGLQNQSVLYQQDSSEINNNDKAKVFLDMNTYTSDGTAAIGTYSFSKDGKYMAYTVSRAGSDWNTAFVRCTTTCEDLKDDKLEWIKFSSLSWTHDNKGFFYSRFPVPDSHKDEHADDKRGSEVSSNVNNALYYHRLGTNQNEDSLVFGPIAEHPKWIFGSTVTDDGNYLLITISESTAPVNRLYWSGLPDLKEFHKFIDNDDAQYDYITNHGSLFWFNTNLNAPKSKIVCHDLNNPIPDGYKFKEVISEREDVLSWVTCVNNNKTLACVYLHNVSEVLELYDLFDGKFIKRIDLPSIGAIQSYSGKVKDTFFFYKFTSFLYPGTIFRCDFGGNDVTNVTTWFQTVVDGFDASLYQVKQIFYNSKDGTSIPMFAIHRKDITLNSSNMTFLYGYGGFSISLTPSYSALRLILLQNYRAVVAIANLRGGSEFGEDWHNAGILDKKQNVFDDFIAAAEYLITHKYTSSSKLAINGGSNGGLLIGAVINQRPELFGCAVAEVGVMDMLRFHKFTIGHFWVSDYGSSEADEKQFKTLYAYSPLHNIKPQAYPSVLVCTSDHDDRVVPLHSLKYIATLQYIAGSLPIQTKPLLARIEKKSGHGAGKPTSKILDERADVFAFIANETQSRFI